MSSASRDGQHVSEPPVSSQCEPAEPVSRWIAVAAIALGVFAFVTTEFLPVAILPQVAHDLGVPLATAGLMLTMPGLVAALSAPAVLLFGGALDRRRLLLVLTTLLVAADLVSAAAPNFPSLLIGRALLGAGLGGFWAVALAVGGRVVTQNNVARALSLIVAGITCATIVGLPVGSLVGALWGWRAAFQAGAALAVVALVAQALSLPSLPIHQRVQRSDFALLLSRRRVRRALALVLCLFGGNLAAYTYLAPYLRAVPGLGVSALPAMLLIFGLTSLLANFVIPGPLSRHPRMVVAAQALAMTISLLGLALSFSSLPVLGFLLILWAIPFGAVPLCLNHWVQEAATDSPEAGSALYVSTVQIAIALGSAAGALAVETFGLPMNLWLGAALSILGGALLFERQPNVPSQPGAKHPETSPPGRHRWPPLNAKEAS